MNQKGYIHIAVVIITVILFAGGIAGCFIVKPEVSVQKPTEAINSFKECAAAGYPIMESYPEQCKTPDGRTFVRSIVAQEVEFGNPVEFAIGEQVKFSDGLTATLVEINDSRCKPDVVCIWAGELSPLLQITGGNAGKPLKEVRLGTERTASVTENGYTFTLQTASPTTATIVVSEEGEPTPIPSPVACTQEAKQCPDGSFVGRTGPNCEFAKCPDSNQPSVGKACSGPNDTSCPADYECVQGCGSPVQYVGEPPVPYVCQRKGYIQNCPICLAVNTLIDTPLGRVPIQQLREGSSVWSVGKSGRRVPQAVARTSSVPVTPDHQMIQLILDDGRTLLVSPGHPTVDGRTVGNLIVNDLYDGARVVASALVSYGKGATYDILPSGETGFYWANGILLNSTLHEKP